MADITLTPSLQPESPVKVTLVDDQTQVFTPAFGRGRAQRQTYGDPRWRMQLRFRGMRDHERARLRMVISEARGKGLALRVSPYQTRRGSFPTSELLTQSTEFTSTAGYTQTQCTLSVVDRMLKMLITGNDSTAPLFSQTATPSMTANVPYVYRTAAISPSRSDFTGGVYSNMFGGSSGYSGAPALSTHKVIPTSAESFVTAYYTIPGHQYGDHLFIPYQSVSRCALVDRGDSILLQSETLGTTWTTVTSSVTSNATASPGGDTTADKLVASVGVANHGIYQTTTVLSASNDFAFTVAVKAAGYNYLRLQMNENGGHGAYQVFRLDTGVLGTTSGVTGANWSNLRSWISPLGNGWYLCTIVARKESTSINVDCYILSQNADNVSTFNGDGSSGTYAWRPTMYYGSFPTQLVKTTTDAVVLDQPANVLKLKGLPVSTSGLLLPGDFFEVGGELKVCTSSLDSDASGRGTLSFRPGLGTSPNGNTPVIIHNPMGRFMLMNDPETSVLFGSYDDVELDLLEVYE